MKIGDGYGVANGLVRGRVHVVVDVVNMPAVDVLAFQVLLLLLLKATPRWNTTSGIQQHSTNSSRTRTSKYHHGHDQVITGQQATQPAACWTPKTIQYNK